MQLQPLTAISPIDGRYRNQLQHLDQYFSEFALMKYRVKVELSYFLFLSERPVEFPIHEAVPEYRKRFFNSGC